MASPDYFPYYVEDTSNSLKPTVYPRVLEPYERGDVGPNFGAFDASTNKYEFTPEGELYKNYFKENTGRDLVIKPFFSGIPEGAAGYFYSKGPGGSTDPKERIIYMSKEEEGNPFIIAHEGAHAKDPNLANPRKQYSPEVKDPVSFLRNYINNEFQSRPSMIAETEAQRGAIEQLQDLGVSTGADQGDPWFKGYPASFIDRGLARAKQIVTAPKIPDALGEEAYKYFAKNKVIPTSFVPYEPTYPVHREFEFNPRLAQNLLDLSLNSAYRDEEQRVRDNTRDYIDSRLGY